MKDNTKLDSEKVVLESPMSFVGATKRIWPYVNKSDNKYVRWFILGPMVVMTLYFVYSAIVCWYLIFGLLLVPFRMIRRSSRTKKQQQMQHQEILQAIAANK